ncbi:MAG: DUF2800 domain-containing protein [Oscillospiraceae bacterium]|nr:DUF2800 domain-containing protein [Oscillospiraceae bacterium]
MNFNRHSDLRGQHAFLSASKYHWINYDEEKLITAYTNYQAAQRGTELHDFAAKCIELGQRLPNRKETLNLYVNDAIGYNMTPEQVLYYSPNCFGTADAICFRNHQLRIYDFKSGQVPAHMEQLEIYAALFYLEYKSIVDLKKMKTELRIYQNNEVLCHTLELDAIIFLADRIIANDKIITKLRMEEG